MGFRQATAGLISLATSGTLTGTASGQSASPDTFDPYISGTVHALAVQADGKILVGGSFSFVDGQYRNGIARLNADGTLDSRFNPGAIGTVYSIAVQMDGKILVGGSFYRLGGESRDKIARLNADGMLDSEFNPGASGTVYSIAMQMDGKILVGGSFYGLGGESRDKIARLNADGTLDSEFNPGASGTVYSIAMQPDGKILVGGSFYRLGGESRDSIGRLNADGMLDSEFNPGDSSTVYCLALQSDGKVLVGSSGMLLIGEPRNPLARLNADGSLDSGFVPEADDTVYSIAVQADGCILVGGDFTTLDGQTRNRIGRLKVDGTIDSGFNPGADDTVNCLALQADGKLLTGGEFDRLGGRARGHIGRLSNTEPATQSLAADGTTITWLRGGSSPEVWRTSFDASTNGVDTFSLGEGVRIPNGWQLEVLNLPANSTIRARGHVTGGGYNGSSWFVESGLGAPLLSAQPLSRTNDAGSAATFRVTVVGTEPFSYQWFRDGEPLAVGGRIFGAQGPTLSIISVLAADAGDYTVVVSNAFGSATSAVARLTVLDPAISVQPSNLSRSPGEDATFIVTAAGTPPLSYQWRHNGLPVTGGTESSLTLPNVQEADAGSYDVVVSNDHGSVTSAGAILTLNLATLDNGFDPGSDDDWGKSVYSLAVEADGRIVVGGSFATLGGEPRSGIGRLNADGMLDDGFDPGVSGTVHSLAVQTDGKILVGGSFTKLAGEPRGRIGRLSGDGTLDSEFNPMTDYDVLCLALQADGKILVGGSFWTLGGEARRGLGRLNSDGTVDVGFDPGVGGTVYSLALQPDGKILVSGSFTTLGGEARRGLGRLNSDGTVDSGFDPGGDGVVYSLAVQADGRILVGGSFTTLGGEPRDHLGRLNADGTLDGAFDPEADGVISSLALQAEGEILVGGSFSMLGGEPRKNIGRLDADGTVDGSFGPVADSSVSCLAVQADGRILVGGEFATLGGQPRLGIGRLNNSEPVTQSLAFDETTITWFRGGAGPEVWRTSFEASTNGVDWFALGDGVRIPGGWQLEGLELPGSSTVRVRGHVTGGRYNGSAWFVETNAGMPLITTQPLSRTDDAGRVATFSVTVVGTEPFSYQWLRDGEPVTDGENTSGAQSPTLSLSDVLAADAGGYSVVVSNTFGNVTSAEAQLTVLDPAIEAPPTSLSRSPGEDATFTVTAAGTPPLSYQWRHNGVPVAGGAESVLALADVQDGDAGFYDVVVRNNHGSVNSTGAMLTVNLATVDGGFDPGASGTVYCMAVHPNGQVVVGGSFGRLSGQPRDSIGRLNTDGTLDDGFDPGANGTVHCLATQADGKTVVGGAFATLAGEPRDFIGRLNGDGSLDSGFDPGPSGPVYSLAVQEDGKMLLGGSFNTLRGEPRNRIARLNADGTLDGSFNPAANGTVYSLALQADGKILLGAGFGTVSGEPRNRIARLNADGTLDGSFNPEVSGTVYSLALQADGKILVGGSFTTLGGQPRDYIGRLNTDGSLDSGFDSEANGTVYSLAVQSDGRILVGGHFTMLGGQLRSRIARLNADGTLDNRFDPGASDAVYSLTLQADGKILVGGSFSTVGGEQRDRIARLNNTGPATQNLSFDGATITWLRGGCGPEVWRTSFDASINGVDSFSLGSGVRIPGGWRLDGLDLPANATVRVRGHVTGGRYNGSAWFVEMSVGAPLITAPPLGRAYDAGSVATFSVKAVGTEPFSYQWLRDGEPLTDGGNISGAHGPTLSLGNVLAADAAEYTVVVSNALGSVTSVVAALGVLDPFILSPPVSQRIGAGSGAEFSVTAMGTEPFSYQWFRDGELLTEGGNVSGAQSATLFLSTVQAADVGDYTVAVSSAFGSVTSEPATLTLTIGLDTVFDPGAGGNSLTSVSSLAVQTDGRILVGGDFTTLGGKPRNRIGRLNQDGLLDSGFNPEANFDVSCLAVQSDGKILVGGEFSALGGQSRAHIGRLNTDGTLDTEFDPGASFYVHSLAIQSDGRILVGGAFSTLGGQSRNRLGRLNADGTLDGGFNPRANGHVYCLAVQSDGKILVGGEFTTLGGQPRNRIGRLNADGTLDDGFDPGANYDVYCLAIQADGKILVGGEFTELTGQTRAYIGRLNADGTLDSGFNSGASYHVHCLALQTDGKILVGGSFWRLGGQLRDSVGRLNADGTLDSEFDLEASDDVYCLAVQSEGRILVGGKFTKFGGEPRGRIARLNNTEPAAQSLAFDGKTITWLRGGSSPEVARTSFEASTNGADTFNLGDGVRIRDGWQLDGLDLPANATIRARGHVTGGHYNGSAWFVEASVGSPLITAQPLDRTNGAGSVATFNVRAVGTEPFSYQWLRDGEPLTEGGNISGAQGPTLSLSNVLAAEAGDYAVVVSNALGSVTSSVASLAVTDPVIVVQPTSQNVLAGETVTIAVEATGTAPLTFQWWKDGVALPGATESVLLLTDVQGGDAGWYEVVVTNDHGTATSMAVKLSVNLATLDSAFDSEVTGEWISALAVQANGKILVGGKFTALGGQPRDNIGRLNPNGTPDSGFNPGANGSVSCYAVQPDGKLLVGGSFSALAGYPRDCIGRLNADGTLDMEFNPGADDVVSCFALQGDGKILVGGYFKTLGGESRDYIGRLNADGTLDTGFDPGASGPVTTLALQADGEILVGGYITMLGYQSEGFIRRLYANGTRDAGFNPTVSKIGPQGPSSTVDSLAVQADGKILVGGYFSTLCGQPRDYIGRLNADGTLDTSFDPGANSSVGSIVVQADGGILVGGWFGTLGGEPRSRIGRLHADGTLDAEVDPRADGSVSSLAVQPDGRILVAGRFATLGGQECNLMGRLNNTAPATQSLALEGTTITWLRGGTSPKVSQTSFDSTSNGVDWLSLGDGVRIPDGWQLEALDLPADSTVRAHGYITGGDGSTWFVETGVGPIVLTTQPLSQTGYAGSVVMLSVAAVGTEPLSYQWFRDGAALVDGGHIAGATRSGLTLSNLTEADDGGYWVVVSNLHGSVTSSVATLSVLDPFIVRQPASLTNDVGTVATFSVTGGGTGTVRYQWLRDGLPLAEGGNISGVQDDILTISNVSGADAGDYSVMVSSDSGSVTSQVATLTVRDPVILVEPVSRVANPGQTVMFTVSAGGTAPLSYQWLWEGTPLVNGEKVLGAQSSQLVLRNALAADAGSYSVVVSNAFGQVTSAVASLAFPVTLDNEFNPAANNTVNCFALQPDGKILVGGEFTTLSGQPRSRIARLNSDGTLDSDFNPAADGIVNCLAVQPDGKILVGGWFTRVSGQLRSRIARLNEDGTLDSGFNPGASGLVDCLALQSDGKILVGGDFTTLGGQPRSRIARLNANGTLDEGFKPVADDRVLALAVQPDGKILVGGWFARMNGLLRNRLARLDADGTLDGAFNPSPDHDVFCLAVQPDGKILVGGFFTRMSVQPWNRIARLHASGALDYSFNPGADNAVASLALQTDGKILVGGWFTRLAGQSRGYVGRLNADGTLDSTFAQGANNWVNALALQEDGKVLAGGRFSTLGGQPRSRIARLHNSDPASDVLDFDGTQITWMRTGTAPEVWRTTFEAWTQDAGWTSLGAGSRIPGGWQLNEVPPLEGGMIRARGHVTGGLNSGSAWLVEADLRPRILAHPSSTVASEGQTVTFSVAAVGSKPLSYQWRRAGVPVPEATQPILTLANVQWAAAGDYDVVVSNAFGSVTSTVATLSFQVMVDSDFDPWASGRVYSLAIQGDGKVLVGGRFTALGGQPRERIGRLNADGTLDGGVDPGANTDVYSLAVQPDGRILVGGNFAVLGGQPRNRIGRLNADGTLDHEFNPGANGPVFSLAVQADGKVLLGGDFIALDGQSRSRIARLNADGSLDGGFNPGANGPVYSLAVQADGGILVGGNFTALGEQPRNRIGRLSADGSLDDGLNPGASGSVYSLATQVDGGILVGGNFAVLGGQPRNRIGRLNADGTLDHEFNPGANGPVFSLAVQADGKVLLGGDFIALDGQSRSRIARLNADGSLDGGFNPGANGPVDSLAVQADGKILVGGDFSVLGGEPRSRIGRLSNTGPATQSLTYDGSVITWLRSGSSPEVWRTTFEHSPDGSAWTVVGNGTRVPGGWQLTGVSLPGGGALRARGYVSGEAHASGWFVETLWEPDHNTAPVIVPVGDQALDELALLTINLEANDADLPPNALTFGLVSGPEGVVVTPEGTLTWTPTEAQGPGDYLVTVEVSDDGEPPMRAEKAFTVTVHEVNTAPSLQPIGDQRVVEGTQLSFTTTSTDADLPPQTLIYSLGEGSPVGASIDASSGLFQWTPTLGTAPANVGLTVVVSDAGTPSLESSQSFEILVLEPIEAPIMPNPVLGAGGFSVDVESKFGWFYHLEATESLSAPVWLDVVLVQGTGERITLTDTKAESVGQRFYRVRTDLDE